MEGHAQVCEAMKKLSEEEHAKQWKEHEQRKGAQQVDPSLTNNSTSDQGIPAFHPNETMTFAADTPHTRTKIT